MYLEITPLGTKIWRMSYRQPNGKRTRLTFGAYPEVSLQQARQRRFEAQRQRAEGIDPAQARRLAKQARAAIEMHTFEAVAREWHANKSETWKENTAREAINRLQSDVFPLVGTRPIGEVDAPLMLDVLKQVEKRAALLNAARDCCAWRSWAGPFCRSPRAHWPTRPACSIPSCCPPHVTCICCISGGNMPDPSPAGDLGREAATTHKRPAQDAASLDPVRRASADPVQSQQRQEVLILPLAASVSDRVPVHSRVISFKGYRRSDGLWDIEGHLADVCPHDAAWPGGQRPAHEPIHSMLLRVTVDHTGLIKQAEASTEAAPYEGVCGGITGRYAQLAGTRVGPGFRRRVLEIAGGLNGCTHMTELLLGMGTAVLQTLVGEVPVPQDRQPFSLDGCHALDTSGRVVKEHYPLWYRPRRDAGPESCGP